MGFFINGIPRFVHQFAHEHYSKPVIPNSHLPIRFQLTKVDSNNDGLINEQSSSWATVLVEGTHLPFSQKFLYTNARKDETIVTPAGVGAEAALVPVFSMKLHSNYPRALIKITDLNLHVSTNNDIYWELIKNPELQSDTWVESVPTGSMIEIDDTASKYARGVVVQQGIVTNTVSSRLNFVDSIVDYLNEPIISADIDGNSNILTFGIRNLSGTTPIKLWYTINWIELQ